MTTFKTIKYAYNQAHTEKLSKIYNQYKQKYSDFTKTITYEEKVAVLNSMLNELKFPGEPVSYDELYDELEICLDDVEYEDHAFDMLSEYPDFDVHTFYYDIDHYDEDELDLDLLLELQIETYRYIVRLRKMLEASLPQKQTATKNDSHHEVYCEVYCDGYRLSDEEIKALLSH